MLFSIWDIQNGEFLNSGLNSDTKEIAIDQALSYLFNSDEFEDQTIDKINKETLEQKEKFLNLYELEVIEHTRAKIAG